MAVITHEQALEEFSNAIFEAGLVVNGLPIADGKIHRVPVDGGKPGNTSGSYLLHLDDSPTGYIKNYKSGDEIRWKPSAPTRAMSPQELKESLERGERERVAREKERTATEKEMARRSDWRWSKAQPAETHPYLERKGVNGDGLRVDAYGNLLVPMNDVNGKMWGIQSVNAEGGKSYKAGAKKIGTHVLFGEIDPSKPLLISEGIATAKTVQRATGLPVVAAFDSGNLKPVALAYREKYPDLQIGIAGDNDHHLPKRTYGTGRQMPNAGLVKAEEAAGLIGGFVLIPQFAENDKGSDWNDFEAQHGHEATASALLGLMVEKNILDPPLELESEPEPFVPEQHIQPEPIQKEIKPMQQEETSLPMAQEREPEPVRERFTRDAVEQALRGADRSALRGKNLSGLNLSNLEFNGMDLSGSDLSRTRNENTIYRNCEARETLFNKSAFRNSIIQGINADHSQWNNAHLENVRIETSDFYAASFQNAIFTSSQRRKPEKPQAAATAEKSPEVAEQSVPRASVGDVLRRMGAFIAHHAERTYEAVAARWHRPHKAGAAPGMSSYQEPWVSQASPVVEQPVQSPKSQEQPAPAPLATRTEIRGNSFRYANFQGARFEGVDIRDNDFNHADISNTQFPDKQQTEAISRSAKSMDPGTRESRDKALDRLALGAENMPAKEFNKIPDVLDARADHLQEKFPGVNRVIAYRTAASLMLKERGQAIEQEGEKLRTDMNASATSVERSAIQAESRGLAEESAAVSQSPIRSTDPEVLKILRDLKGDQGRMDALLLLGVFDAATDDSKRKELTSKLDGRHSSMLNNPKLKDAQPWQLWIDAAESVKKEQSRNGNGGALGYGNNRDADKTQSRQPARVMTRGR